MKRLDWKKIASLPRDVPGFVEGAAIVMTVVLFMFTYWSRSQDVLSELVMQGIFLGCTVLLTAVVIYGVLLRHYLPFISPMIVCGAGMIGISRLTATLSEVPAFQTLPLIGPDGWGYLVHHDDMMLYPGFILMLGGFYLSIVHAARMRRELLTQAEQKERALRSSEDSAAVLARRVALDNLATSISTRFINVGLDEIDAEINRSLAELGRFAGVDRAYISFTRMSEQGEGENFEWCAPGVAPFKNAMDDVPLENFRWAIGILRLGESIRAHRLSELPPEAAFERDWFAGQGTRSVLNVPIISNHTLHGYIGFDSVTQEMEWPDETEPLLRMIGEILFSAWERRCSEHQRRLLELQVQQARKLESLGVMAGGIAHDFNNLLTGIMGNAELAQLEVEPESDSHRYLEGVIQSSRRAAELCRQMLAYAGRGKFITQPVDLNELITSLSTMLHSAVSRRADLVLELADSLPEFDGDMGQFRQVLDNLVTNAAESMDDGRGTVTVRTSLQQCGESFFRNTYLADPLPAGEYVCLEVRDSGSGMTPEVREKIFEPFFTTRFAGRGLGMPAVLGIVRSHNGAIRLESEPGRGTTVQLYFPVNMAEGEPWLVAGESQGDWHGHGTILLADDEDLVLSVGSMMLRHLGLDVVTADNGETAIERARAHAETLQCAILDYDMPGTEIGATCRQLRAELPGLPIVIASGHSEEDVASLFPDEAVAAFLPKPFELVTLRSTLRQLLETVG